MDRRSFLRSAAGAAVAGALPARLAALGGAGETTGAGGAPRPIGAQLYTVRTALAADPAATLAAVRAAGYAEVEFAGLHGRPAAQWRRWLDAEALAAPAGHVGMADLGDTLDRTLDDAAALGHRWVVLPWVDAKDRRDRTSWERLAERLNVIGERAAGRGMRLGYHNHGYDTQALDGLKPLDLLLSRTDRDLVDFELDIYWMVSTGANPRDYCVDYPGRFALAHLKDSAGPPDHVMRDVGAGTIRWPFLLDFLRSPGGLRHVFVEHDSPADAIASLRAGASYLRTLDGWR